MLKIYYSPMDKIIFRFCLAVFCLLGKLVVAQTSIVLAPNPAQVSASASEVTVNAHMAITNSSAVEKTFRWERTVVEITAGCATSVCDPEGCFVTGVSTNEFILGPNQSDLLDVDLINPNSLQCCAVVHMKVYEVGNPANEATGIYLFNNCASNTTELQNTAIRLFPNPVTTTFTLENAAQVKQIRLFNLEGKLVRSFQARAFETYDIADLLPGSYIALLDDVNSLPLKVLELIKN